jgi:hypothetical protein
MKQQRNIYNEFAHVPAENVKLCGFVASMKFVVTVTHQSTSSSEAALFEPSISHQSGMRV